jgi:hypothetical protein
MGYLLAACAAALAGMAWGRWTYERSLTICPEDDGVVGPQSVWVRTPRVWSEAWEREADSEADD